jgi:hypothetical protein
MLVRRSSDNATQNIGYSLQTFAGKPYLALDQSAFDAFVGSTGVGYAVTWFDQSGNSRDATQTTATAQPAIRKGAKNLNVNSEATLVTNGLPNGWGIFGPAGITITTTIVPEVIDGITRNTVRVRFLGTATSAGTCGIDSRSSTSIPAQIASSFTFASTTRIVEGSMPIVTAPFRCQITERTGAGSAIRAISTTISPTSGRQRTSTTITCSQSTTAFISNENRFDIASGTFVDVTIAVAMPMCEAGILATPSAYVPTFGLARSNGIGYWWLDFDGVNDSLSTSPFQMSTNPITWYSSIEMNTTVAKANELQTALRKSGSGTNDTAVFADVGQGVLTPRTVAFDNGNISIIAQDFGSNLVRNQDALFTSLYNNTLEIYRNGVGNGSVAGVASMLDFNTPLSIGSQADQLRFLQGSVSEAIIWADNLPNRTSWESESITRLGNV